MDKKKLYIIVGSAVAGTLLIVGIVAAVLSNRPSALITSAAVNTAKDIRKIEAFQTIEKVSNGGSVAVSANLDKYANDISIQGKVYTDVKNSRGAYEMTIYDDEDVMVQPRIYYGKDSFVATCPELFDGAYGINFKKLDKNLPDSIFDPDEDTDYSLPEGLYDYLIELSENSKGNKELERDLAKAATRYEKFMIQTVLKYADVEKSSDKIKVGGDNISCTVITINVDEDAIVLIMQDLIDYINNDKSLEDLLTRYYEAMPNMSLIYGYGGYDAEDMVDAFYDEIDDLEDSLDYIEDMKIDLEGVFYITKSGKRIAQMEFDFDVNGEKTEIVPVNDALMAIKLNAGKHDIRLEYIPHGFKAGACITCASVVVIILLAAVPALIRKARASKKAAVSAAVAEPSNAPAEPSGPAEIPEAALPAEPEVSPETEAQEQPEEAEPSVLPETEKTADASSDVESSEPLSGNGESEQ